MPRRPKSRSTAKQETRDALVAAALAEFGTHGLDNPSLDAICARAGFTRGAFYVHFRSRDELLAAVMEHVLGAFLDAVIARGDDAHDLERTVGRFADAVAEAVGGRRGDGPAAAPLPTAVPFSRVLEAISRAPKLRARFATMLQGAIARLADVVAQGQRGRAVRRDVAPQSAAFLLVT